MKRFNTILRAVVIALLLYLGAAHAIYALRHPELTDTQRFLRTIDAVLFR